MPVPGQDGGTHIPLFPLDVPGILLPDPPSPAPLLFPGLFGL